MGLERLIALNVAVFVLVASRIAGFIVVSPFPGQHVSVTQRTTLLCTLSWIAISIAPRAAAPRALDLDLAGRAVVEVGCGLLVGLAFRFLMAAADVLGSVAGQMAGHSTPSVLNPTLNAEDTAVSRLLTLGAVLVALAIGAHRVALANLLESFRALPVGTVSLGEASALRLVDVGIDAFVVGVRLGTPLIAVALMVQTALAVVSRAAPSVQIFSVGFGVLFLSGTLVLMQTLGDITTGFAAHLSQLTPVVEQVLTPAAR